MSSKTATSCTSATTLDMIVNLAFYKFAELADPDATTAELTQLCEECGLMGSVIVASEGVNGMLAGTLEGADRFCEAFLLMPGFAGTHLKRSYSAEVPFKKLRVRVKSEIVVLRAGDVDVNHTATHLAPEDFRDAFRAGDAVVIDTRNDFEFNVGTFEGSINPKTTAFSEFIAFLEEQRAELEDKKVLMFCTGGIRCEKATAWMQLNGFENVFQLEGGVLNYFERVEDAEKDWKGELFVFDQRIALNTKLEQTAARRCTHCGLPIVSDEPKTCACGQPINVSEQASI